MMMSGGFAAFSFGIFFEGMNINLPGNVLRVAGFCITHAQLINVFWDGLKSPNKPRGAKVSPVSLSKPEWKLFDGHGALEDDQPSNS